ncbi:MAG: TlpA disulfide reductase family protein [Bacteroidia bacterium]
MKTIIFIVIAALASWGLLPENTNTASKEAQNQASPISAPEISLQDLSGQTVPLSSLRGNIVLIDFWASWCRPCRYEMKQVLTPLYQKYHDKGFDIYSVSLDQNQQQWAQASQQENITWTNVSDLQGWHSPVAQTYGINKIPSTFLLDKEGNIIAVDLRGDRLAQALAGIFD